MPDVNRVYAVCQLGAMRFAIAADDVVQAIPRPTELLALPQQGPSDTPLFMLRGQVLPLLDLTLWLPRATPAGLETAPEKVMVLRRGEQWLAIEIHELVGMRRSTGAQVAAVRHGTSQDTLFHSVLLPDADNPLPLPLLDTAALLQLSGTWGPTCAGRPTAAGVLSPGGAATGHDNPDGPLPSATGAVYAWLGIQGQTALLETRWLASVEPMPALQRISSHNPDILGIAHWRGHDVQVVQITRALGPRTQNPAPLLAMLTNGEKRIGLAVDAARHIETMALHGLETPSAGGLPDHPALKGVWYHPGGQRCLVIDPEGLLAQATTLGSGTQPTWGRLGAATTDENTMPAHVVFQAGTQWAMPIDQIEALTVLPDRIDSPGQGPLGLLGSFHWRRQAVPLWDLKRITTGAATEHQSQARVVLARHQGRLLGLLAEQLLMLLPARQGVISTVKRDRDHRMTLITVRQPERAQSFRVLHLGEYLPDQAPSSAATAL